MTRAGSSSSRSSRSSSLSRGLLAAVVLVGLLAAAVGAVVLVLRAMEPAAVVQPRCTAGDHTLAPDQTANAALIVGTSVRRGLPARAGTIGIATALQESWMRNIDFGDRDSLGMFQQRPSQGWGTPEQVMDPVYAVNIFYDHLVQVPGYTEMAVTEAAQAVQRSAFPEAYAKHEGVARAFAQALAGWSSRDLACILEAHDGDPASVPAAVVAQTERDYGVVGVVGTWPQGEIDDDGDPATAAIIDVGAMGRAEDTERLAWAVAHGAVAGAIETGAGRVLVGDSVWERETGAWRPAGEGEPMPGAGIVVVGP